MSDVLETEQKNNPNPPMNEQTMWRYALASVIGTSHGTAGTPCQDASLCQIYRDTTTGRSVLVAAVSDGAGSATRSQDGAAFACSLFAAEMESYFEKGGQVEEITRSFITEWLLHFQNEIRARADAAELMQRDFACTFLAAVIGQNHAAFIQVGDGAIVISGQEEPNRYEWIFWPQKGEYENMTYFATDPAILQTFEFDTAARVIDDVCVFSDGLQRLALDFAAEVAHEPFFRPMFAPLHTAENQNMDYSSAHLGTLSEALQKYLSSPTINQRTDDDKTLVLATRRKPQAVVTAPLPSDDSDALI